MPHMVFMMKKKWFTTYLLLTNPTAMLLINPLSPNINMHLLHTVLHMVLLERFFFNITTFHLWFIISLILMTCLFDQAVLLLGEIGCESLLGLKGAACVTKFSQIRKLQNARRIKRNIKITAQNFKGRLNNITETTDVTDGQKWRRLKRIEIRIFENCSA